ncbi:L,D-transpeptidase family protein [Pseudoxanthomonas sp. J35]|uniref:L,D-transpeptidase family protein n=1 Tax=Pseudoxanthomonas sp. J35 TaxID=935852 RepID=UPI0004B2FDA3|nr:L,D-transpeptidase family protein [Pseudoxanthomonas sp. J35]
MAYSADRSRSTCAGRFGARLCTLLLALCASAAALAGSPLQGARQLVLVTTAGWDASQGTLRYYQREGDADGWREAGGFAVAIGRNGSAWGTGLHADADLGAGPRKREGDGRSPAGAFAIGPAFGYAAQAGTAVPYLPMQASHWCMDVPDSPHYNLIVDAREVGEAAVAGSSEPMRLDLHGKGDPRYRLGLVIGHNPGNVPQGGSCIFAHLWRKPGEATAGCTAMADADMEALLAWLDPAAQPRFVLLPAAEHARLAADWQLPAAQEAVR